MTFNIKERFLYFLIKIVDEKINKKD